MLHLQTTPILHFRKELSAPPVAKSAGSVAIRTIEVSQDVSEWLALRNRAVAGLTPPPRPWTVADFQSEMLAKTWWRADRCWIAETDRSPRHEQAMIGTVTLAERAGSDGVVPIVHWLLVDPQWRRRGIGHSLMNHLERAACEAGYREVQLETHAGWSAAIAFYQSIGYAPVRGPAPR